MKTTLIVDGNNLGFKIYASFKDGNGHLLTNSVGLPTTVIFGMLRSFEAFVRHKKVDQVLVAWDVGGGSAYRRSIYPLYKKNRVYKEMDDYFAELDACREYFEVLGIPQAPLKGIEADDTIGWLATRLSKGDDKVVIYSDDKDYYQLLGNKRIKIWRPCKEEFFSKRHLLEEYGDWVDFKPKHLILIDALCGQEKDFIPGACDVDEENVKMIKFQFGPAKAKKLLEASGYDMKVAYTKLKEALSEKFAVQLEKNWKQVLVSRKLSRIRVKDEHYSAEELKKLKDALKQIGKTQVKSQNVVRLVSDLELRTVDVFGILKNIGVEVIGKQQQKTGMKIIT